MMVSETEVPVPTTIMAIAAHPGDALFTMGAAVARHIRDGGAGVFVSLTYGEKGAPRGIPLAEYGKLQRAATEKASRLLGASFELLDYPDAELPMDDKAALAVCDIIRKHKPAIVLTHWSGSWHKDHQNCHLIVRDAVFYAGLATLARKDPPHYAGKIFYAENWEDDTDFRADVYLDITPVYEKWIEACAEFPMWRGETGFRYSDYYSSLAVMRGCLSGFRHAVALMRDPNQRASRVHSLG
jgi:LmbE family N-acetylglucosaminyl deacetylase